jgi:Fibronectin type III domain
MNTPTVDAADILPKSIVINWVALTNTQVGNDPVTYYKLEWDTANPALTDDGPGWTELTQIANGNVYTYT